MASTSSLARGEPPAVVAVLVAPTHCRLTLVSFFKATKFVVELCISPESAFEKAIRPMCPPELFVIHIDEDSPHSQGAQFLKLVRQHGIRVPIIVTSQKPRQLLPHVSSVARRTHVSDFKTFPLHKKWFVQRAWHLVHRNRIVVKTCEQVKNIHQTQGLTHKLRRGAADSATRHTSRRNRLSSPQPERQVRNGALVRVVSHLRKAFLPAHSAAGVVAPDAAPANKQGGGSGGGSSPAASTTHATDASRSKVRTKKRGPSKRLKRRPQSARPKLRRSGSAPPDAVTLLKHTVSDFRMQVQRTSSKMHLLLPDPSDHDAAHAVQTAKDAQWEHGSDVLHAHCMEPEEVQDYTMSADVERIHHMKPGRAEIDRVVNEMLAERDRSGGRRKRVMGSSAGERSLRKGLETAHADQHHVAISHFSRALACEPGLHIARHCRAISLTRLARYEEALEEFTRVLQVRPSATAHFNRSVAFANAGMDWHALQDLDAAIQRDSHLKPALQNRALILRRQGKFMLAKRDYARLARMRLTKTHELFVGKRAVALPSQEDDTIFFLLSSPSAAQDALRLESSERTTSDVEKIQDLMRGLHFFRDFSEEHQRRVCKVIHYEAVGKDYVVCKQGQQANKFFIILSGSLAVRLFIPAAKAELTLNSMDAGTSFGQLGLLRNRPRTVTCITKEPTELLWLGGREFFELGLAKVFNDELAARKDILERSRVFAGWSNDKLDKLAVIAQPMIFDRGDTLVKQGADPEKFYILKKGICKVVSVPNQEAALQLRLQEVRFQLLKITLSDVYHRSLRERRRGRGGGKLRVTADELAAVSQLSKRHQEPPGMLTDAAAAARSAVDTRFHLRTSYFPTSGHHSKRLHRRRKSVGIALRFINRATNGVIQKMLHARRQQRPTTTSERQWLLLQARPKHKSRASKFRTFSKVTARLMLAQTVVQRRRQQSGGNDSVMLAHDFASMKKLAKDFIEGDGFSSSTPASSGSSSASLGPRRSITEEQRPEAAGDAMGLPHMGTGTGLHARAAHTKARLRREEAALMSQLQAARRVGNSTSRPSSAPARRRKALPGGGEERGRGNGAGERHSAGVTVARVFPVSVIGEMALLDPWGGKHQASVVAETHVEVLAVSKKQFDMKAASEAFLANVRRRSTTIPSNKDVERLSELQRQWTAYKKDIIGHMKKARWPPEQEQLHLQHATQDSQLMPSDLPLEAAFK